MAGAAQRCIVTGAEQRCGQRHVCVIGAVQWNQGECINCQGGGSST